MTKKKIGIIASAAATCAVCSAMIIGSTFALFTSEDKVDVTVTSGNVSVTSAISQPTFTRAVSITDTEADYTGAETKTVPVEGNKIDLSAVSKDLIPGDKLEFDVKFANSGGKCYYQYSLGIDETLTDDEYEDAAKLFSALSVSVTLGEETVFSIDGNLKSYRSSFSVLNETEDVTYHVTIVLPPDVANGGENEDYSGLTANIVVGMFAVQENAAMVGNEAEIEYYIN